MMEENRNKYEYLLVQVDAPRYFPTPNVKIPIVFSLLSGSEFKGKKVKILNDILIDWVSDKKKLAKNVMTQGSGSKWPSPGTLNAMIRAFFAATKDQYVWEFVASDFNFDGGYNGFFKALCAGRQKRDVSINTHL